MASALALGDVVDISHPSLGMMPRRTPTPPHIQTSPSPMHERLLAVSRP